ncbi:MAG: hypothetical protein IT254_05955 [Chitinophagaceae bacterium]|nr:hypothetical protein [Bacteroidota bacterium]MCC6257844.1 hypothetical protein [Chitinophagaceae bacterium]MCW5917644.1 hypothetical protein [Ferruginibacter sp.]
MMQIAGNGSTIPESKLPVKLNLLQRIYAHLFSILFHPVFIPLYVTWFLLYLHPSAFAGFDEGARRQTLVIVAINLVFFPLLSVVLLRALRFIDSIQLHSQRDRIIPYIAVGIFYFWSYLVFSRQPLYPPILSSFILGIFLASSACLIANIYFKISMHATGMGAWVGVFLLIMFRNEMLMTWPLSAVFLIGGLVLSARMLLSAHTPKEIYLGLIVGLITQFVAAVMVK